LKLYEQTFFLPLLLLDLLSKVEQGEASTTTSFSKRWGYIKE